MLRKGSEQLKYVNTNGKRRLVRFICLDEKSNDDPIDKSVYFAEDGRLGFNKGNSAG